MNIHLALTVLDHIKADPDSLMQSRWRCRTGMCFAGHTAVMCGGEWYTDDPSLEWGAYMIATEDDPPGMVYHARPSEGVSIGVTHVENRARQLLDLSYAQSRVLFAPTNTLDSLEHIIRVWAQELLTS